MPTACPSHTTAFSLKALQVLLPSCTKETTCLLSAIMLCYGKSLQWCPTLCDPMDLAHQSVGFSRQEYWSGLPRPSPGDLPDSGIEPVSHVSCIAGGFFITSTIWEALFNNTWLLFCSRAAYEWNHTKDILLCLSPLIQHVFEMHPHSYVLVVCSFLFLSNNSTVWIHTNF